MKEVPNSVKLISVGLSDQTPVCCLDEAIQPVCKTFGNVADGCIDLVPVEAAQSAIDAITDRISWRFGYRCS